MFLARLIDQHSRKTEQNAGQAIRSFVVDRIISTGAALFDLESPASNGDDSRRVAARANGEAEGLRFAAWLAEGADVGSASRRLKCGRWHCGWNASVQLPDRCTVNRSTVNRSAGSTGSTGSPGPARRPPAAWTQETFEAAQEFLARAVCRPFGVELEETPWTVDAEVCDAAYFALVSKVQTKLQAHEPKLQAAAADAKRAESELLPAAQQSLSALLEKRSSCVALGASLKQRLAEVATENFVFPTDLLIEATDQQVTEIRALLAAEKYVSCLLAVAAPLQEARQFALNRSLVPCLAALEVAARRIAATTEIEGRPLLVGHSRVELINQFTTVIDFVLTMLLTDFYRVLDFMHWGSKSFDSEHVELHAEFVRLIGQIASVQRCHRSSVLLLGQPKVTKDGLSWTAALLAAPLLARLYLLFAEPSSELCRLDRPADVLHYLQAVITEHATFLLQLDSSEQSVSAALLLKSEGAHSNRAVRQGGVEPEVAADFLHGFMEVLASQLGEFLVSRVALLQAAMPPSSGLLGPREDQRKALCYQWVDAGLTIAGMLESFSPRCVHCLNLPLPADEIIQQSLPSVLRHSPARNDAEALRKLFGRLAERPAMTSSAPTVGGSAAPPSNFLELLAMADGDRVERFLQAQVQKAEPLVTEVSGVEGKPLRLLAVVQEAVDVSQLCADRIRRFNAPGQEPAIRVYSDSVFRRLWVNVREGVTRWQRKFGGRLLRQENAIACHIADSLVVGRNALQLSWPSAEFLLDEIEAWSAAASDHQQLLIDWAVELVEGNTFRLSSDTVGGMAEVFERLEKLASHLRLLETRVCVLGSAAARLLTLADEHTETAALLDEQSTELLKKNVSRLLKFVKDLPNFVPTADLVSLAQAAA